MTAKRMTTTLAVVLVYLLMAASAEAKSTVTKLDFGPVTLFNTCTGETIVVSGTLHLVVTPLRNGEVKQHLSLKGTGVSDLGVTYQWNVNTKVTNDGPDFVAESYNRLIGQGPSNNQFIRTETTFIGGVFTVDTEIICR